MLRLPVFLTTGLRLWEETKQGFICEEQGKRKATPHAKWCLIDIQRAAQCFTGVQKSAVKSIYIQLQQFSLSPTSNVLLNNYGQSRLQFCVWWVQLATLRLHLHVCVCVCVWIKQYDKGRHCITPLPHQPFKFGNALQDPGIRHYSADGQKCCPPKDWSQRISFFSYPTHLLRVALPMNVLFFLKFNEMMLDSHLRWKV